MDCRKCGMPIEIGKKYCVYCGTEIERDESEELRTINDEEINEYIRKNLPVKNKTTAGVLGLFLGGFGLHRFYMGNIIGGIIMLCLCWTGITWIIGVIEGIWILCQSKEGFERRYGVRAK